MDALCATVVCVQYTVMDACTGRTRDSELRIVEMDASERLARTGAAGAQRLRDASVYQLATNAFNNVLAALADPKCKHVPYRDAAITHYLSQMFTDPHAPVITLTSRVAALHFKL